MNPHWVFVFVLSIATMLVIVNGQSAVKPLVKTVKGKKLCDKGWECKGWSAYCCNETISDYYQPLGFGTTGGKINGMKEVAAFLGHVGSKTSCKNYNYGNTGEALKVDLLNHPEYIEQNATLAFQAAIWRWMTPLEKHQPSAHDVFVGNWKPTKNDTLAKRVTGFGTTMNVLYGDLVCGKGPDKESMNNIISHYLYYLDFMGVGREEAGPNEVLTCADQLAFNPSSASST